MLDDLDRRNKPKIVRQLLVEGSVQIDRLRFDTIQMKALEVQLDRIQVAIAEIAQSRQKRAGAGGEIADLGVPGDVTPDPLRRRLVGPGRAAHQPSVILFQLPPPPVSRASRHGLDCTDRSRTFPTL